MLLCKLDNIVISERRRTTRYSGEQDILLPQFDVCLRTLHISLREQISKYTHTLYISLHKQMNIYTHTTTCLSQYKGNYRYL